MRRFVPLPDPRGPAGSARMWVNPDHIISLTPKLTEDSGRHVLRAELKLIGTPTFDAWLGDFDTREAADSRWTQFLTELSSPTTDE